MNYIVPIGVIILMIYASIKGVDCYDAFIEGAKEAALTLIGLLPNLGAMLAAIALFRSSGADAYLAELCAPVLEFIGIPRELAALVILRPFSGSGALAMLSDLLSIHGADSFIGLCASVTVGSTETIFYTLSIYCGAAGVRNARYALPAALISGLVGTVSGIALVRLLLIG
ncbi:MAG: spore maturation protein [Clostridia bacterium]|nr:spore maturation protein [Clostridia bacterium]